MFKVNKDYDKFFTKPIVYKDINDFGEAELSEGKSSHIIKFQEATIDFDLDIKDNSGLEFLKHERSVKYLASAQPIPSGTQFKPAQTV